MYDFIKQQLASTVPFAKHAGVEVTEVAEGEGAARLEQTGVSINHIGSQHAGALFTLGETASGAAMAGAFAPVLLGVKPVAGSASINFRRIAKGTIAARAATEQPAEELLALLEEKGKVRFPVNVELIDECEDIVADMVVEWSVSKT